MNQRQADLLRILSKAGRWMTGKELAGLLGVSDRTVRSDVAAIMANPTDQGILSNHRYGYRIKGGRISAPLPKERGLSQIPEKPAERCGYILRVLLEKENGVSTAFLKKQLFFSDSSIERDLVKVKGMLNKVPGPTLKRVNSMLCLEGGELAKRKLCQRLLLDEMGRGTLNLNNLASYFPHIDLIGIWNEMDRISKELHYEVREVFLPVLVTYLGISVERIMAFHFCGVSDQAGVWPEDLRTRAEYRVAEAFFRFTGKNYDIRIPQPEIDILAGFLLDRQHFLQDTEDRIDILLGQVLEQVFVNFQVDLRGDQELVRVLKHHISVLLYQDWIQDFEFPMSNQEIKSRYPLSFEIACFIADFLKKKTGHTIVETELGFITLHLQCAYERKSSMERYRILAICPYNHDLMSYFMDRMKLHFDQRAVVTACLPMFERDAVLKERPDLILTTFSLKHDLAIPTLQISLFMSASDENKIFEMLNMLDGQRFRKQCIPWMATMVTPQFFYEELEAESPQEVIRFLCGDLEKAGYIEDRFTESVLDRERMSSTAFAYQFALPHSLNVPAVHSVLSVAFLKRPIVWGTYEVSLVLLPVIAAKDRKWIEVFFNWLGNVITEPVRLSALLKSRNWLEFQKSFQ